MRHFENPIDGVRFWHAAVRDESEDSVLVIGGYATHTNVSDPETKHPDVILRYIRKKPLLAALIIVPHIQHNSLYNLKANHMSFLIRSKLKTFSLPPFREHRGSLM